MADKIKEIIEAFLQLFKKELIKDETVLRELENGLEITPDVPTLPEVKKQSKGIFAEANKLRYPNAVKYDYDPTTGGQIIKPQFVILHHTVSYDLEATAAYMKKANVSVHYLVGQNGAIIQMAENNRKCWHAGSSSWKGLDGLNSYSVGIEVVNIGQLKKVGNSFRDYYDRPYTGAVHVRKGLGYEYWAAITPEQEKATLTLCQYLHEALNIPYDNFLGHYEISPNRKADPYGLFSMGDMTKVRQHLIDVY